MAEVRRISIKPSEQSKGRDLDNPYRGVPTQDERGHSSVLSAKVATFVKRQVDELMRNGEDRGWKCDSDFFRFCYRLGLDYVAAERKDGESHFLELHRMNRAINALLQVQEDFASFDTIMQRGEKLIQELTARGQHGKVRGVIFHIVQQVMALKDEDWKRYYMKELEQRFGAWMKRHKVSFKPKDFEKELTNPYERG